MTTVCIGLRSSGSIDLDFLNDEEVEELEDGKDARSNEAKWNFNNLTLDEAEFVLAELTEVVKRARTRWPKRKAKISEDLPTS